MKVWTGVFTTELDVAEFWLRRCH